MRPSFCLWTAPLAVPSLLLTFAGAARGFATQDPSCAGYQAWVTQSNPRSDTTGMRNVAYPEANTTYWATQLTYPQGTTVTIKGRFPQSRYMSLQIYDSDGNVVDAIRDDAIKPDSGTNNPYQTGSEQGTYTVNVVFGRKPPRPAPNTIYAGSLPSVPVIYRVYYSDFPDDLTGATFQPVLPVVSVNGTNLTSCPPRPTVLPEDATVWGRLDNGDFAGTPLSNPITATNPPMWVLSVTNPMTPYYPSQDNSYMSAFISRAYFAAPYNYEVVVMQMRAPTFPDTQAGEAPYLASTTRQVRYWSMCQDEPLSTGVVRCIPDNQAVVRNGLSTFVISDPSKRPSEAALNAHGARWMPWGALPPADFVYDIKANVLTNADGVYYYGLILYRQTMANPSWTQSMTSVEQLPRSQWQTAMGDYWPRIGYCKKATFESLGAGCIGSASAAR